ncbi:MAG: hypothetical protein V4480_01985 [Patescibacteria group bacterium]
METEIADSPRASAKPAPWGVFIAILLILLIVVAGAYYTLTKRITPQPVPTSTTANASY